WHVQPRLVSSEESMARGSSPRVGTRTASWTAATRSARRPRREGRERTGCGGREGPALAARAVPPDFHSIPAGLRIAPAPPTVRGSIDEEPAAQAVPARAQSRSVGPERDERRHQEIAELGPSMVDAREGAVR